MRHWLWGSGAGAGWEFSRFWTCGRGAGVLLLAGAVVCLAWPLGAQVSSAPVMGQPVVDGVASFPPMEPRSANLDLKPKAAPHEQSLPPHAMQAEWFLAERGGAAAVRKGRAFRRRVVGLEGLGGGAARSKRATPGRAGALAEAAAQAGSTATWQPAGPFAVVTPNFGPVTGRVTALALDPSDATGNHLYVGTTGGGVWVANNAAVANASLVSFTPLTDAVEALNPAVDASISIGALTVQPGGACGSGGTTGVILAGTGDPNDALDSYYGAGVLRSADCGNSWSLIDATSDQKWVFSGEGFAGFAWSTVNPQLVVAALSQAYEGTLVDADEDALTYMGLYSSLDGGATWSLATVTDGPGEDVQGPNDNFAKPNGNAATAVVWNPVRQLFVAAVRFHGYYQSTDGMTWTRMTAQPGAGLAAAACPTNSGFAGSIDCPIFRGSLAVNPQTGDTFAWTVDEYNQDQGLWQDACTINVGGTACTNQTITFANQLNTAPLETNTAGGPLTIENGDYNLALAAVPYGLGLGEDTWVLAGGNDLWRCSVAAGCVWRNTTNATTCMSAGVAEFQHALAWNTANPLEIMVGNDGGLWRSLDAIGETGQPCAPTDATHVQNLNGGLGSLAEVVSLAASGTSQYGMMTGLGVNGTAGVKSGATLVDDWPQILGGYGGPAAIDPHNTVNWYVNSEDGVSIYLCSDPSACTAADFGTTPVVTDADVGGDGYTMGSPAPFIVDPLDPTQLLIGTCRVWRGPADGTGWSGSNAISPILDSGATNVSCSGDALIRSMAALPLANGGEVVYVGMYGENNGGANLPGHVLTATIDPASAAMPVWTDLTLNPVTNSAIALNSFDLDISSIFIDGHDPTGNTVYVTVAGFASFTQPVQTVYGSTDGGVHWQSYVANLPGVPANAIVVDPQSATTAYVATDVGVYFTTQVSSCVTLPLTCWSVFGTGLPGAPVEKLSAAPASAAAQVLTAATYGRGVWQTPLWTAGTSLTTATVNPGSLVFANQIFGTASSAQSVVVTNTGTVALMPTSIAMIGDFSETDNCRNATLAGGANCSIQVTFTPTATGNRTGQMTIYANVYGGQLSVALSGTGAAAGVVTLTPAAISFDGAPGQTSASPPVAVGTTSGLFQVEAGNSGTTAVSISSVSITGPFAIAANSCGTSSLAADTDCQIQLTFTPMQEGAAAGTLTFVDGAGTQTVQLNGFGYSPPTDTLNPLSLAFPATAVGQQSAAMAVNLTNTGDLTLTSIAVSVSAGYTTSNSCGTQLAGHSACTISVVFAPTQLGSVPGSLTVGDALQTQTVALTGTGVEPATLGANPASLTFASQNVGVASTPQTLTITDTGGVAAANVGFQITGAGAASFSTGTTTCGATLAAGGNCTVQVIFTPATAGGNVAALTISSSTLGAKAVTVPLNGAGQAASGLNVSPAQLTFAATVVGTSSAPQTVTISNTSSVAASQLALAASAGFTLSANTCGTSLSASTTCSVGVEFAPTVTGASNGTLNVASPSIATHANVTLMGTGALAAALEITPATIVFPVTGAGQTSSATTVTVTDTGVENTLTNLALTAPVGFELVNNTCAANLGPGVSCTTGVEFAPTAAGAQTGNLTVTSGALTSTVALSGMGFDFTVTVSGSSAQSVASGQNALYTLALTPLAGSSGAFTFACDSLPADAVCTFSPTAETLNPGVTGNVTVQVSTGGATALLDRWSVLPLVCGLVLLPMGWKRGRRRPHEFVLLAALAILLGGVASCAKAGGGTGGGGGGSGSGTNSTPPGTYSIPVTVTSTGISHSATVTLTVD
jgi:hypothetical protein